MKNDFEVLADGFVFLEGPRWKNDRLWFSDMWGYGVYSMTEEGDCEKIVDIPGRPSGLCFLPSGELIVVSMTDRKLLRLDSNDGLTQYADLSLFATADANDMVIDSDGGIYVGNFGYDLFGGAESAMANLLRVAPDASVSVVAEDMSFPNGTVISEDGKTLICAETFANCLTAFTRHADGTLSNRRVWADLGERTPDGICLDAEGAVWVSSFGSGEFLRVFEGGRVGEVYTVEGKRAVACNLGGKDGRTLFALTFEGEIEDISKGAKNARIEVRTVDVPGAGSP
jgi:sugar lactone lactonase YvrE